MRKTVLFVFLLIPFISFSQSLGIKGGLNHSWVKSSGKNDNPMPLNGPTVGLVFYPGISKVFDIGIEPSYSIYGMKVHGLLVDNNGTVIKSVTESVKYKYLEFPITFNIFPVNKKVVLNLHAGVSPMIFLAGTDRSNSVRVKNKLQISPLFGVTAGYYLSKHTFVQLTGRYMFTTRAVYENSLFDDTVYAINVFAVLGYKF
ncbi:MAG: PorT family protein [Sporocytophaga sp.]|nr:PorT family protein [Sporocytophaga sp.]